MSTPTQTRPTICGRARSSPCSSSRRSCWWVLSGASCSSSVKCPPEEDDDGRSGELEKSACDSRESETNSCQPETHSEQPGANSQEPEQDHGAGQALTPARCDISRRNLAREKR